MKTTCIKLLSFILLFFLVVSSRSQDVMILKTGDEIKVKVLEVLPDIVKYKKWDNTEGPTYSSNKSEIFMIKYQNGTKDVFNATREETKPSPLTNVNTDKIIDIAKPYMEQQISSESKGAIKLIEFKKQNGVLNEVMGQKIYTLEYDLTIEAQRAFWKKTGDKLLNAQWYWGDFYTLDNGSDGGWDDFNNNWNHFDQGTLIEITGELPFENTENGWRVTGINMFSRGFTNKTSKILSNSSAKSIPETPPANNAITINTKKTDNLIPNNVGYIGSYLHGKKDGKGKMVYENGNIYDGEWKDDKREGQGKMIQTDGTTFEGQWKDNHLNGEGIIVWANGRKYIGNLINDQKNGKGVTYAADGSKEYEGAYYNGNPYGHGVNTFSDNEGSYKYEGEWKAGNWNGQGTYTENKSGKISTCSCEFKDGKIYNGNLVTIDPDGSKYITEYLLGKKGKTKKQK
jgi:hypothetical protein